MSDEPWKVPWTALSTSDIAADLRAFRDHCLAQVMPDKHVPGCVELNGEWICSPQCRVKP